MKELVVKIEFPIEKTLLKQIERRVRQVVLEEIAGADFAGALPDNRGSIEVLGWPPGNGGGTTTGIVLRRGNAKS